MTLYTVHAPADAAPTGPAADRVAFVKDGFSWPALLIPVLWLPYRRMWWPLLGFLAATVGIGLAGARIGESPAALIGILFSLWFALEANAMRRWTLDRRGYHLVGVVEGRDRDTAERRFFEAALAPAAGPATADPAGPVAPARPPVTPRAAPPGVIGLFPDRTGVRP